MAIHRLSMSMRATLAAFLTLGLAQALLATQVTITRDDWGIAHVKGKTDADASIETDFSGGILGGGVVGRGCAAG
jgi:acyl-homoserine lactone acylase PvdQ